MAEFSTHPEHCQFLLGITEPEQIEAWFKMNPQAIGFAMVGRSNVGKSSLINTFFGQKTARVSKTPGRTRQINVFEFNLLDTEESRPNKFYLFDLPGYGHAEISKEMAKAWGRLMDTFFKYIPEHIVLLNIQDSRHPDQDSDQAFYKYVKPMNIPTFLVFNKIDKLKKQSERSRLNALKPQLFKNYKWVKSIFFISAESKQGIDPLKEAIMNHLIDRETKVQMLSDRE